MSSVQPLCTTPFFDHSAAPSNRVAFRWPWEGRDPKPAEDALSALIVLPQLDEPRSAAVGATHRAVGAQELAGFLDRTLAQTVARKSINWSVCDPASVKLAFELDALGVAYRDMPRWGSTDRYARIGVKKINEDLAERFIYHRHVRVAVRDSSGSTRWAVLDPTIGQFFYGERGAPRPEGGFFGNEHGMGVYTFSQLRNA